MKKYYDLLGLEENKFKEIQEAYDRIKKEKLYKMVI